MPVAIAGLALAASMTLDAAEHADQHQLDNQAQHMAAGPGGRPHPLYPEGHAPAPESCRDGVDPELQRVHEALIDTVGEHLEMIETDSNLIMLKCASTGSAVEASLDSTDGSVSFHLKAECAPDREDCDFLGGQVGIDDVGSISHLNIRHNDHTVDCTDHHIEIGEESETRMRCSFNHNGMTVGRSTVKVQKVLQAAQAICKQTFHLLRRQAKK